jgi:putative secretion ATPase (PEP-CTERM system associated)
MYEKFYGLREKPFNVTPDPRFLFPSPHHREALAHIQYGVQARRGFVVITGEVGTGKTTLVHTLLNGLDSSTKTAVIFSTYLTAKGLLRLLIADFGIASKARTKAELLMDLNAFLLQQFSSGANAVLIVDEAHNLSFRLLEEIRMLSNLETDREKLLQIILVGQPELAAKLAMPQLRQLRQRISSQFHIHPLNRQEVAEYIQHRLRIAGMSEDSIFDRTAVEKIYQCSKGIPRLINSICDNAMLLGYTYGKREIGAILIDEAVRDLQVLDSVSPESPEPDTVVAIAGKKEQAHFSLSHRVIQPLTMASGLLLGAVLFSMAFLLGGNGSNLSSGPSPEKPSVMSASVLSQRLREERATLPAQLVKDSEKEMGGRLKEKALGGRLSEKEIDGRLNETDHGTYYSVHVASFEELSRAKRLKQIMKQNGFEPVFIVPVQFAETGLWLRVMVGKYQDRDVALQDAQRFLASGIFDYAKPELLKEVNEDEGGGLAEADVMASQITDSPGAGDE